MCATACQPKNNAQPHIRMWSLGFLRLVCHLAEAVARIHEAGRPAFTCRPAAYFRGAGGVCPDRHSKPSAFRAARGFGGSSGGANGPMPALYDTHLHPCWEPSFWIFLSTRSLRIQVMRSCLDHTSAKVIRLCSALARRAASAHWDRAWQPYRGERRVCTCEGAL